MPLSTTFSALADPTRRAILAQLGAGELTVSVLAEPHAMSLPAITKHLKVLEEAGLVRRRRVGRQVLCSAVPAPLGEAEQWLVDQRAFWESALDRLETLVTQPPGVPDARPTTEESP